MDGEGNPVPTGEASSKVLLTNLVNRVQPLIRYELSDAVALEDGPDPERAAVPADRARGRSR